MSKPPITIKCDCGGTRDVAYGERWHCEACGRSWNTAQIPAEEYEGLLRRVRRHKIEAVAATVIAAGVMIPLIAVSARFLLLVPVVMAAWLFVLLPYWRRRYHRTARSAPRWNLRPE